jgi:hypothetical protein
MLKFGGKMQDCVRKGWVIRRKWDQPWGWTLWAKPGCATSSASYPSDGYDQVGSIQGGVNDGLAEGFRLSVLGRGYHFCGASNGASMVLG